MNFSNKFLSTSNVCQKSFLNPLIFHQSSFARAFHSFRGFLYMCVDEFMTKLLTCSISLQWTNGSHVSTHSIHSTSLRTWIMMQISQKFYKKKFVLINIQNLTLIYEHRPSNDPTELDAVVIIEVYSWVIRGN